MSLEAGDEEEGARPRFQAEMAGRVGQLLGNCCLVLLEWRPHAAVELEERQLVPASAYLVRRQRRFIFAFEELNQVLGERRAPVAFLALRVFRGVAPRQLAHVVRAPPPAGLHQGVARLEVLLVPLPGHGLLAEGAREVRAFTQALLAGSRALLVLVCGARRQSVELGISLSSGTELAILRGVDLRLFIDRLGRVLPIKRIVVTTVDRIVSMN